MPEPTEVFNCEYFEEIHRKINDPDFPEFEKQRIRMGLNLIPEGQKILEWLKRPLKPGLRGLHTIDKFNE